MKKKTSRNTSQTMYILLMFQESWNLNKTYKILMIQQFLGIYIVIQSKDIY